MPSPTDNIDPNTPAGFDRRVVVDAMRRLGPATVSDIAARAGIGPGSVRVVIRHLIAEGWAFNVDRRPDPADRYQLHEEAG